MPPTAPVSPTSGPPSVHVVVLNWNGWRRTEACVRSLAALEPRPRRIWVVDNGSTDDSVPRLRSAGLPIALVENGANLGFGAGCNRGIARALAAGADYVWLLNNDTRVAPQALAALVRRAEQDPRIGAVGSVLHAEGGQRVQAWGGGGMSLWTGRPWHAVRPTRRLRYLTAASLLLRASAIRRTGPFDEGFFFYFEDTDLGFRLRRDGWRLAVAEDAVVWHAESSSLGRRSAVRARYFASGLVRFLRKHAPFPPLPAMLGLLFQLASATRHRSWPSWAGTLRGWAEGWRAPLGTRE